MTTAPPLVFVSKNPASIDRRAGVSPQDFSREYLYPHRPVVLTDAIRAWPALTRWTLAGLRERFAEREVVIKGVAWLAWLYLNGLGLFRRFQRPAG